MLASQLLRLVVTDPALMGVNDRQAKKLYSRLQTLDSDWKNAVRKAIDVGKDRAVNADGTIYIANAGSSGSHWAQAMLAALNPSLPCGEVYFSKKLLNRISMLSDTERETFMQSYYAIHGWKENLEVRVASAINTAHMPNPIAMMQLDRNSRSILLLRDPIDITISRTFRKNEYRAACGHSNTSDAEYMALNIEYVKDFFSKIDRGIFDIEIRYEDLLKNPTDTMRSLVAKLKLDATDKDVVKATTDCTAAELVKNDKYGNLFTGKRLPPPPDLLEQAKADLEEIRTTFGYF